MIRDRLFNKIDFHHENLKKKQSQLLYANEGLNKKIGLAYIPAININIPVDSLGSYTYFKTIKLNEVLFLRKNIANLDDKALFWVRKIYSFLEYRLSSITNRIKINYNNKKDRIIFIQNIITLMLEYYDISKDVRYLSIALKLLRIKSISKLSISDSSTSAQYSYNFLFAYSLTKEL